MDTVEQEIYEIPFELKKLRVEKYSLLQKMNILYND